MYKLNKTMIQNLKKFLQKYHNLFDNGRCSGWQLEELIVKSIKNDLSDNGSVIWSGNNHKIEYDILIDNKYKIQIKSGKIEKNNLILSSYRLGRFKGDLIKITYFLNNNHSLIIATPYFYNKNSNICKHCYQIFYLPKQLFQINYENQWQSYDKLHKLKNSNGIIFNIYPSMSWQLWLKIPLILVDEKKEILEI